MEYYLMEVDDKFISILDVLLYSILLWFFVLSLFFTKIYLYNKLITLSLLLLSILFNVFLHVILADRIGDSLSMYEYSKLYKLIAMYIMINAPMLVAIYIVKLKKSAKHN